jgi:chromosome partitioning protein
VDERQAAMHLRNFEHVILDTEARPGEADMKTLVQSCDLLILPSTPEALSLQALDLTLATLTRLNAHNYRVLLTMVPPRPNRDGEEARAYLESMGIPLFRAGIRRLVAFSRAALSGTTVNEVDRTNLGWADYEAVGEEIDGRRVGA